MYVNTARCRNSPVVVLAVYLLLASPSPDERLPTGGGSTSGIFEKPVPKRSSPLGYNDFLMPEKSPDAEATSAAKVPPSPEEVRAALESLLASASFTSASRSSRFLQYVVDETLEG